MEQKRFLNKVAIITGSSRGIGSAIALALGEEGAKIVLNGRDEIRLQEVQSELKSKGIDVIYCQGDVSDANQAQALIDFALLSFGQIDILINNVGISSRGYLAELHPSVVEQVFRSNVFGTIFPTQMALKALRQTKGSVVFISSLAAIHGLPGLSPYSASKMALTSFVESLRIEEHAHKVHIGHLQVAMTEIVHNKEVVAADGSKQVLAARQKGKVLTMQEVAADCLNLLAQRKYRNTQTLLGKMNRILNSISPLIVEFILRKNIHKFEENSK
jgi:NAD(P)-dependent dehydrogenase (short-subunit alcohol dehydrogenase family)